MAFAGGSDVLCVRRRCRSPSFDASKGLQPALAADGRGRRGGDLCLPHGGRRDRGVARRARERLPDHGAQRRALL
ncbi:putative oxidoreductase domain protein [Burkholderia pseudomallei A79C]|nr:putative oxidoreductase domain protein [Burkholderia pseudomallei A79C]